MSEIKKYQNWPGLEEYTKEFKEWIWKLFRKVHARIGHVEEELAKVRETIKCDYRLEISSATSEKIVYTLFEKVTGEPHGSIEITADGSVAAVQWYDNDSTLSHSSLTKVYRWDGAIGEWNSRVNGSDNTWDDAIVFGHVLDNGIYSNKLYFGKKTGLLSIGSWEFKSSITVTTLSYAETLASYEFNVGLIINIVNDNPNERGTYIVNGEHKLEDLRETWEDDIDESLL